jgi:hypothetical protein
MRLAVTLLCLLTMTAACDESSPTGPTISLDERFTLTAGGRASLEGRVGLEFVGVTGDSRCPGDAICITGGDAVVQVRATGDAGTAVLELHTGDTSRASVSYGGVRVALIELQPYPFSSLPPIVPSDYRVTLQVTASR